MSNIETLGTKLGITLGIKYKALLFGCFIS